MHLLLKPFRLLLHIAAFLPLLRLCSFQGLFISYNIKSIKKSPLFTITSSIKKSLMIVLILLLIIRFILFNFFIPTLLPSSHSVYFLLSNLGSRSLIYFVYYFTISVSCCILLFGLIVKHDRPPNCPLRRCYQQWESASNHHRRRHHLLNQHRRALLLTPAK